MATHKDELGAHVSTSGGIELAPERAAEIDAVVLQLFTKQPQRWADPKIKDASIEAFRSARERHGIQTVVCHESYLPNLATPDEALREKSYAAVVAELHRCARFGIEYVVSHPGNATDGDRDRGLEQNAELYAKALDETGGDTILLVETTAGQGNVLGSTFEEIARMIDRIPATVRDRVGVCIDTCHIFVAGYDLRADYEGVMAQFDDAVGLDRLKVLHLNDSQGELGSHRDRHAWIGDGHLGVEPFREIMLDDRLRRVVKLLETPKGDDATASDRENLRRLRVMRDPS